MHAKGGGHSAVAPDIPSHQESQGGELCARSLRPEEMCNVCNVVRRCWEDYRVHTLRS